MKIVDGYGGIAGLIEEFGGGFDLMAWERYADDTLAGLAGVVKEDIKGYDFDTQIFPVLKKTLESGDKIREAHRSFLAAASVLEEKLRAMPELCVRANIAFYLGLCSGAGWATEICGTPSVLLGVEKIIEIGWCGRPDMDALISHELGHVWHAAQKTFEKPKNECEKGVLQLFNEGVAMCYEQRLLGGNYYRQDAAGWLSWCVKNKKELAREYLSRLQNGGGVQDFFGDWENFLGYSDTGYFIGCEFVKYLLESRPLNEIAKFNALEVYALFKEYVRLA